MTTSTPERVTAAAPVKTKADEVLEESFYKELAAQAERLDKFALELIKLQLAIPALYAGILKLLEMKVVPPASTTATTLSVTPDTSILLMIFIPWFTALILSYLAVFPLKRYQVKANPIIEPLPEKPTEKLAINAYFHFSAKRKMLLLAVSGFLTFFGIAVAVFGNL